MIGLIAGQARAETITLTIVIPGHTITISGPPGTPASLVTSSDSNSLQINTANLNKLLATDGSAYQFGSLGVTSNWAGTNGPNGAYLQTAGGIFIPTSMTGGSTSLVMTATEDGFTAPIGSNGDLKVTANANYASAPSGSTQMSQGSYNAVLSPLETLTSSGLSTNNPSSTDHTPIGTTTTGFSLDNHLTFGLIPNTSANAADGFTVTAQVTAVVPEPASIVMFLTGMPLPLVVVGLLRRRRRAVA
jgi:hypothetical protein